MAAEGLGGGGAGEVAGGPASPHHGVRVLGSLGSLDRAVELHTCGDQSVSGLRLSGGWLLVVTLLLLLARLLAGGGGEARLQCRKAATSPDRMWPWPSHRLRRSIAYSRHRHGGFPFILSRHNKQTHYSEFTALFK